MTNFNYLASSVEAGRIASVEIIEELAFEQHEAEQRQKALSAVADYSPPFVVCHLGADKWVAIITGESGFGNSFTSQFCISLQKEIYQAKALTSFVLSFRCRRPAQWVREEIALGFLPF